MLSEKDSKKRMIKLISHTVKLQKVENHRLI